LPGLPLKSGWKHPWPHNCILYAYKTHRQWQGVSQLEPWPGCLGPSLQWLQSASVAEPVKWVLGKQLPSIPVWARCPVGGLFPRQSLLSEFMRLPTSAVIGGALLITEIHSTYLSFCSGTKYTTAMTFLATTLHRLF
jgi:hypothetical protein